MYYQSIPITFSTLLSLLSALLDLFILLFIIGVLPFSYRPRFFILFTLLLLLHFRSLLL